MQTVLTIAGFDPSSGAGVTADLAVFAAHGLFGTAGITALTVQSTTGVRSVHPVKSPILLKTLEALEDDLPPAGIKIGMLGSAACVAAVAQFLESLHDTGRKPFIVLDPVLRSTSGKVLLGSAGVRLLVSRLLPLVDFATPNVSELCVLAGAPDLPDRASIVSAALDFLKGRSRLGLVVTGGDSEPPDDLLLLPPGGRDVAEPLWMSGMRVQTTSTHGTGCVFSSALLSRLVLGDEPRAAAHAAKLYVAGSMRAAKPLGRGKGPTDPFWALRSC